MTPSQDNMEQNAFILAGLSKNEGIGKSFLDSQPLLLRGDSINGNEEMGSFPAIMQSLHQSLKPIVEIEPCPTPRFEGEKLKKEEKKVNEQK